MRHHSTLAGFATAPMFVRGSGQADPRRRRDEHAVLLAFPARFEIETENTDEVDGGYAAEDERASITPRLERVDHIARTIRRLGVAVVVVSFFVAVVVVTFVPIVVGLVGGPASAARDAGVHGLRTMGTLGRGQIEVLRNMTIRLGDRLRHVPSDLRKQGLQHHHKQYDWDALWDAEGSIGPPYDAVAHPPPFPTPEPPPSSPSPP